MHIITVVGKEKEGAYSDIDEDGEQVLYIFMEEDDATRYSMQLEELGYPEMTVLEVDDEVMIKTCEMNDYQYAIITKDDFVIPPSTEHDFI